MCNARTIRHARLSNESAMLSIMANAHNLKMIKFWCAQGKVMSVSWIEGIRWMAYVSEVFKSLDRFPYKQKAVHGWLQEYNARTFSHCSRSETAASSWIGLPRDGRRTAPVQQPSQMLPQFITWKANQKVQLRPFYPLQKANVTTWMYL